MQDSEIIELFNRFDADKNGNLDTKEIRSLVAACGYLMDNHEF